MPMRVLLVEDETNILEAVRFLLSRDGWEVYVHCNGATAVDEIVRRQPSVVVLDVMLPGRSGMEILRDLRSRPDTADLPVVMLTAKGQDRERDHAHAIGANAYLSKPFANAELLSTVRAIAGVPCDGTDARA